MYVGYFHYTENLNWAAQNPRLGCMRLTVRGLDIAGINPRALPLSAVTFSLHYLRRCLRLIATSTRDKKANHRDLQRIFEYLLQCYCYATKANSRTVRSRVSQSASAGEEADLVNCKLITVRYENSEPDSCAVCVISANKLSFQELTELIRTKQLTSRFPEIFAS